MVEEKRSEPLPPLSQSGFDAAAGLRRVGGNLRLYADLLRQFVDGHAEAATRIQESLSAGDRATAERIAHSVKGVAGNIGATAAQAAAAGVEKAIRNGADAEIETHLPTLARTLEELTARLREYLQSSPPEAAPEEDDMVIDAAGVEAAVGEIAPLLEQSDPSASDILQSRRAAFRSLFTAEEIVTFERHVGGYSFDDALEMLQGALSRRTGRA